MEVSLLLFLLEPISNCAEQPSNCIVTCQIFWKTLNQKLILIIRKSNNKTFFLDLLYSSLKTSVQFDVRPDICVSGTSPESVSRLLGELAQYGTHYLRLGRFSLSSTSQKGLVFQVTHALL